MSLLEVDDLTKTFGGVVANNHVSLSVNEGEIVGLIGPNGAGKTTLFNCVAAYYHPDKGAVRFAGHAIHGLQNDAVCRLGIARTFQVVKLFNDMTTLENVLVGALLRRQDVAAAREAAIQEIRFAGLAHKLNALAGSLTIAEKKRVELTRALATQPRLLLLDEVMAGLTPTEQKEAVDLVLKIRSRGVSVLMVEHVMEVLMPISDRVVVLDQGNKIAEDVPANIVRNPLVIKAYLGERYSVAS